MPRTRVQRARQEARERRKRKQKKKEDGKKMKIVGTKDLTAVLGTTALDPKPTVRRQVKKRAKRAARKKGRRGGSSSSTSQPSSSGTEETLDESGHLFGEEVKVKMVGKRFPSPLTLNTLEQMQAAVVTQSGQPWDLDRTSLPPNILTVRTGG